MRLKPLSAIPLALAALAAGCSPATSPAPTPAAPTTPITSSAPSSTAAASPTTTDSSETASPTPTSRVTPSDSEVGQAAQWILDALEGENPTAEDATARFAPSFLAQIPANQVGMVFDQLRPLGPFTLGEWNEQGRAAMGRLDSAVQPLNMQLSLDEDGLIDSLLFTPYSPSPTVESIEEAATTITGSAPAAALLVADAAGGKCTPLTEANADQPLPIGSMFKLYVLGAVATAVENGTLTWDDTLTVTADIKSLPSGELQDAPDGTEVTVREAAEKMIAISDNTATDMLIAAVGREAVEAELAAMGHGEPELNLPFLTTGEAFQLANDAELRQAWADASAGYDDASPAASDAQRGVIADLPAWDRSIDQELFAQPFWPVGLDWFATSTDLCRAHLALQERAETEAGEPIRAILSANPGSSAAADYIGFKGGASVGEMGLSYYLENGDSQRVVVVIAASEGQTPIPTWLPEFADQVVALALDS